MTARIRKSELQKGFILDNSRRTVSQAEMIDRLLKRQKRSLDVVIELAVDEEELVNRLRRRIEDTKKAGLPVRPDDNEETFRKRQAVYREQTAPLIPYYVNQGKLRRVDGMGTVEEVAEAIDAILDEITAAKG
ncbi:MAG: nucleoside monophosphate kinase [Parvularculaceae bacterium]